MTLFALSPTDPQHPGTQIVAAAVLATVGVYFLLPKARGRSVPLGVFLCLAAFAVLAVFSVAAFGSPSSDLIGQVLFYGFSAGALGFGTVLVTQRNPARGALAFAFVILSSCGLFLLLAAPFLMAATVIIYAGAIVVTFLFVLMLTHADGPTSENDRTREPLLGSLAGFAFAGLVLFALYQGQSTEAVAGPLPTGGVTSEEKAKLLAAAAELKEATATSDPKEFETLVRSARTKLVGVVGTGIGDGEPRALRTVQDRLRVAATDARVWGIIEQADRVKVAQKEAMDKLENGLLAKTPSPDPARPAVTALRDETLKLAGRGELPAKNVSAIGHSLYSEHLLAVEMAGTLLLVATIGAVAIARRKAVPA